MNRFHIAESYLSAQGSICMELGGQSRLQVAAIAEGPAAIQAANLLVNAANSRDNLEKLLANQRTDLLDLKEQALALLQIVNLMSGQERSAGTLDAIAGVLQAAGYNLDEPK